MAAKPLDSAFVELILSTLAEKVRSHPDVPFKVAGAHASIRAFALVELLKASAESRSTWQSRFTHVEHRYPSRWAEAKQGVYERQGGPVQAIARPNGMVRRFLITSAQNETAVHEPFWENLLAFSKHLDAEIMVGGFTYQLATFTDHAARAAVFAEVVQPYLKHEQTRLGADVLFCAEMNTLPTAKRPLSGLDTYTQGRWGIFPHAKIQLVSVPTHFNAPSVMLMTTGACTVENYTPKKAGQVAQFHHCIGATVVEIDPKGRVFCRQISASDDGSFQDLDAKVRDGAVTTGHRIEAITNGDIHIEKADPVVARAMWGIDAEKMVCDGEGLIDILKPRFQFHHDLVDFMARNHHRRGDHLFRFQMYLSGEAKIDKAFQKGARFLRLSQREFCQSVVIPSNHNDAFPRWLREGDPREDEVNARLWFQANDALYEAAEKGDKDFDVVRWALARHDPGRLEDIVFPPRSGSFLICQQYGGIENIYHGDKGPNGARGSPLSLSRTAMRINAGHAHSPSILDGVYTAGLFGLMDQGYNADSASSWAQSLIVTYPSGKRTIVTLRDGLWRA